MKPNQNQKSLKPMKQNSMPNPYNWFSHRSCRAIPTLLATCALFGLAGLAGAQSYNTTFLWYQTNGVANLVNDNNNRGIAYNILSNQVYVAGRTSAAKAISVLDGTSGAVVAANIPNVSVVPYTIGCADDGVIYGVPLANGVSSANLN